MNIAEHGALADALAAEHAAVYAYGVVAAFALASRREAVAAATRAHATRRDALTDALTDDGATAPLSAPGYALPAAVTDAVTAMRLAVTLEDDTALAWRSVLERSDPVSASPAPRAFEVRTTAVTALTDCAVRAAGWRLVLGTAPATRAFPGQPNTPGG